MKMLRNLVHGVWLLSFVAAFLLLASASFGQEVCPAVAGVDTDEDGFLDTLECRPNGVSMNTGLQVEVSADGALGTSLPSCFGMDNPDRRYCMSPAEGDLFVIVVPASPSLLPPNPFETLGLPVGEGGLGLNLHLLTETGEGDRVVSPDSSQKAVRITEDLDPDGDKLGQANYGTPNNIDRATIWTVRIANFVAATCTSSVDSDCVTNTGAVGVDQVTNALAAWVCNHEGGHNFKLSHDYNKRFGGYHLKAGVDSIMTQFVSFSTAKRKSNVTTFFIPETFDAQSQADALLQ